MSLRQNIEIKESLAELEKYKSTQLNYKQFQKLNLLILLKKNASIERKLSATQIGITLRSQERWLSLYKNSDISIYLSKQTRNKKSKFITDEIHQGLSDRIHSSSNCFKGYWDAHHWVNTTYNISISYYNLRLYLIKHFGSKLKVPRKSHYKKNQDSIDGFLKNAKSS